MALVGRGGGWKGTASELLERITPERPPRGWPQTPQAITGALKRVAPALRASGISVDRLTRGQARTIVLSTGTPDAVRTVNATSRTSRSSRDPSGLP